VELLPEAELSLDVDGVGELDAESDVDEVEEGAPSVLPSLGAVFASPPPDFRA
jgi:hypothetical protein